MANEPLPIVEYTTVVADHAAAFDIQVNERIKEGWQPYGFPYTAIRPGINDDLMMYQTMVKRAKPPKTKAYIA